MPEKELRDSLQGVRAPEGLWDAIEQRLQEGPGGPRRGRSAMAWTIAAGLMVTLGASWLALWGREPDQVAIFRELCGHPEKLEVRTADLLAVRQFAAEHGHPVKLLASPPRGIELIGASSLGRDRIGVAYRTDGALSALLVEPAGGREIGKVPVRQERDGVTLYRWRSGRQAYTLMTTLSGGAERACGICHLRAV